MQEVNGTFYHDKTPREVIDILEAARLSRSRLRLWYGSDGRCWNEENDTIGRIGRSTGSQKIPILIKSKRSLGGGGILDHCIIRIDSAPRHTVYRSPSCRFDHFVSTAIGTVYNETRDELYARCKSADAAARLAAFMNGERWSK